MSTEDKVKRIIAEIVKMSPDQIKSNHCLVNDLGADSMDVLEIIMDIEDKFKIIVSDSEESKIRTIQDIVNLVERKYEQTTI